ncbi:TlpA family protein disulfide reductase [Chitinimonas sp. BJB300]|uniref:TlpA family protein disulfide reductase n=1 Tax=Chitinimonas sp. BJB300 TaxID=1559339 RepID=UPI000C0F765B|nr:TlpA disulfide reductase family protein [Chitinimonas sp. BJB300]PHV10850.1 cytochrome C biogenesis protein [Chitinimonas sp. BJB300]TSJ83770.1 TlpA family protein disulfide reductase [Chitinimonas sp. BJB300]
MKSLIFALTLLAGLPAYAFKAGDPVDAVSLAKLDIDGGKVVVLDFFAEWCGSCRKEIPLISTLNTRTDPSKVEVVGVDVNESATAADAFQNELRAKNALNFRVVNDPKQELVAKFRPLGFPALYVIKDGKVASMHIGAVADIDKVIERELKALGAL